MNTKQKIVLWSAVLFAVAMGAYPPWLQVSGFSQGGQRRYTYGWLFSPPVVMAYRKAPLPTGGKLIMPWEVPPPVPYPDPYWRTELDVGRLALQGVMLFMVAGACYLAWPGSALTSMARLVRDVFRGPPGR